MVLPKATSYRKATLSSCDPVIWAQKGAKLKCARWGVPALDFMADGEGTWGLLGSLKTSPWTGW